MKENFRYYLAIATNHIQKIGWKQGLVEGKLSFVSQYRKFATFVVMEIQKKQVQVLYLSSFDWLKLQILSQSKIHLTTAYFQRHIGVTSPFSLSATPNKNNQLSFIHKFHFFNKEIFNTFTPQYFVESKAGCLILNPRAFIS